MNLWVHDSIALLFSVTITTHMPDVVAMADHETTTITVSIDVWRELQQRKDPGDSFDDVLRAELGLPVAVSPDELAVGDARQALDGRDLEEDEREALLAVWRFVREEGRVSPQDIKETVYPDHSAGKGEEWWWKTLKGEIESLPGIERPKQRTFVWTGERDGEH